MHVKIKIALKPNFMSSLLLHVVILKLFIFFHHLKKINLHDKNPIFASHKLSQNVIFIPEYDLNAIQDDLTEKLFPSDCITL